MTQFDGLPPNAVPVPLPGNAGTVPAGAVLAEQADPTSPPLQIIVGAKKPLPKYTYIRNITPDTLSILLEEFDRGMLRNVVPAWRKMARRDGHLLCVSEKRLFRLGALDWEITPSDDSPEAARQADFAAEFLEAVPCLETRFAELSEALKYRISGHEIEWLPGAGPKGEMRAKLWPQNCEDWDLTLGRPRLLVNGSYIELPADKFIVHVLPVARMEASSILYVIKMITASQWLAFGEKFGMPGLVGEAPAGASQEDVDKFYEMLCAWAQELVTVCKEGYKVTPLQVSGGTGNLTYPAILEWADEENSKIWTGHILTSDAQSGSGTLAGNAASDQLDDLTEADAVALASTLNESLLSPAVRFQFGQELLCKIRFKVERPLDRKAEADTDAVLVNDLGLDLPKADLYTKYRWRKPDPGEEVVTRQTPPLTLPSTIPPSPTSRIPLKAGGVETQTAEIADDFVPEARAQVDAMIAPLQRLIDNAGKMTEEELRQAIVSLELPSDGFAGIMQKLLDRAMATGAARTTAHMQAAMGGGQ